MFQHITPDNMSDQVHNDPRRNLNKCGIGFAGVDGVWQRPACEAFELLEGIAQQLDAIGPTLFAFIDAIGDLYRSGTSRRFRGCWNMRRRLASRVSWVTVVLSRCVPISGFARWRPAIHQTG